MVLRIADLSVEQWSQLSPDGRLDALRSLERALANQEGRDPCPVETVSGQYDGGYDPQTKTISVNEEYLSSYNTPYEAVHTLLEESRHAYQHDTVLKGDPARADSQEQFNDWKMAYEGGKLPDTHELAKWQPAEVDARRAATDGVIEMYGDSPNEIKAIQTRQASYREDGEKLGPDYEEQARKAVAARYAEVHQQEQASTREDYEYGYGQ
jgi:hypothetical protein